MSEMSEMSEMSGTEWDKRPGEESGQDRKYMPSLAQAMCACLLLVAICSLLYAMTSLGNFKELICTVGATASLTTMYPDDGICDYLYYTHVLISYQQVVPTEIYSAFEKFKKVVKTYNATKGGLSFDIKYIDSNVIKYSRASMTQLDTGNIGNYGLLGMVAPIATLESWVNKAKEICKEFKNFQGSDETSKTVVAIGTFGYSNSSTWAKYKELFNKAIASDYNVDTVIVVTSNHIPEDPDKCKAIPPAVITAMDGSYPSFYRHKELVKNSYPHSNYDIVVGVSLEMGALTYRRTSNISNINQFLLGEDCVERTVVPVDAGCDVDEKSRKELSQSTNVAIMKGSQQDIVIWESPKTAKAKVHLIKALPPWHRFSWLVYDVHMVDLRGSCKAPKFKLLQDLKSNFGMR